MTKEIMIFVWLRMGLDPTPLLKFEHLEIKTLKVKNQYPAKLCVMEYSSNMIHFLNPYIVSLDLQGEIISIFAKLSFHFNFKLEAEIALLFKSPTNHPTTRPIRLHLRI